MTLDATSPKTTYTGNGATTEWDFTFRAFESTDIVAVLTVIATGEDATIDPGDYTVTLDGENGGTVTYPLVGDPLASTHKITLMRSVPQTQDTALALNSAYSSVVVEERLDRLTATAQELQTQLDRTFKVGVTGTAPTPAEVQDVLDISAGVETGKVYADATDAGSGTAGYLLDKLEEGPGVTIEAGTGNAAVKISAASTIGDAVTAFSGQGVGIGASVSVVTSINCGTAAVGDVYMVCGNVVATKDLADAICTAAVSALDSDTSLAYYGKDGATTARYVQASRPVANGEVWQIAVSGILTVYQAGTLNIALVASSPGGNSLTSLGVEGQKTHITAIKLKSGA